MNAGRYEQLERDQAIAIAAGALAGAALIAAARNGGGVRGGAPWAAGLAMLVQCGQADDRLEMAGEVSKRIAPNLSCPTAQERLQPYALLAESFMSARLFGLFTKMSSSTF